MPLKFRFIFTCGIHAPKIWAKHFFGYKQQTRRFWEFWNFGSAQTLTCLYLSPLLVLQPKQIGPLRMRNIKHMHSSFTEQSFIKVDQTQVSFTSLLFINESLPIWHTLKAHNVHQTLFWTVLVHRQNTKADLASPFREDSTRYRWFSCKKFTWVWWLCFFW